MIFMKTPALVELILRQLDNLGYQLNKRGITDRVNRHNCIAIVLVQQQKWQGELARIELHGAPEQLCAR
jgi:hypothetical protein